MDKDEMTRVTRYSRIAFLLAAIVALVMAILPHPPELPGHLSDKIQHMMAFATLGVLGAIGFTRRSGMTLFLWLTAFGAFIEVVQAIPALHRDSDYRDLIADMIAAAVALAVTRLVVNKSRVA